MDSLKNWINTHPKIDSQYIVNLHKISYRLSEKDVQQSFEYYEKVSQLSDSLNFVYGKALAQINLGILLFNSANFDESNSAYFKAIDEAEACDALRLKAICFNNIGENFRTLNDLDKCREYTTQAIAINSELGAWRGVAINYELLHECDLQDQLYTSAKNNLFMGMPFALKANESYILSQYYLGFGKLHAINNQTDSALFYFKKAMDQAMLQNDLRNKYNVYMAKAKYLKKISSNIKINFLDSAYSIATRTSYMEGIAKTAELLSSVYDEKQNKDSSWEFYHIYRLASDSLFSKNNRRNVIIKESNWMLNRKEIENNHLKELSQIQKKDLVIKNALLWVTGFLLILLIIIALFIYKNIQSKKKRAESSFKQKIAETQMQSLRAQMNPHFIFNCLNSIENFMMRNEKRTAIEYLNKFSVLIRIILDSSRTELVPFAKDLEGIRLYVELEQLRFNNKFSFETHIDPLILNEEFYVPSLLIQPYIENAILHGLSQSESDNLKLQLSATLENDYIIYVIEDNGIGREQSKKYKIQNKPFHESIGLQLSQERINIFNLQQKSKGEVKIEDIYNHLHEPCGTRVELKIKAV
ncbi:MAG: histidine kinase [Bacteroidota bacterium]|nr:histidine kinase [Bacteroidota bacterium]